MINPASEPAAETFVCLSNVSWQKTPNRIVSVVVCNKDYEVKMICYNQAKNRITTMRNYGPLE